MCTLLREGFSTSVYCLTFKVLVICCLILITLGIAISGNSSFYGCLLGVRDVGLAAFRYLLSIPVYMTNYLLGLSVWFGLTRLLY